MSSKLLYAVLIQLSMLITIEIKPFTFENNKKNLQLDKSKKNYIYIHIDLIYFHIDVHEF